MPRVLIAIFTLARIRKLAAVATVSNGHGARGVIVYSVFEHTRVQVPGVYLCTRFWRHDAYGMYGCPPRIRSQPHAPSSHCCTAMFVLRFCLRYVGVALGYGMLDILLLVYIWRTDFQLYANKAVERSEATATTGSKKVGR